MLVSFFKTAKLMVNSTKLLLKLIKNCTTMLINTEFELWDVSI